MDDRRQSMPLPSSPATEAEFRQATEAMKKAADAMIAATESFRHQFHQHETTPSSSSNGKGVDTSFQFENTNNSHQGHFFQRNPSKRRPVSYQPQRSVDEDRATQPRPSTASVTASSSVPTRTSEPIVMTPQRDAFKANNNNTRNPYLVYREARANSFSPPTTPIPAHIPLTEFFPKLPQEPQDEEPVAVAVTLHDEPVLPQPQPQQQQQQRPHSGSPSLNVLPLHPLQQHSWTATQKAPSLADSPQMPYKQPPPLTQDAHFRHYKGFHKPSSSSHIDLVEAASRLKRVYSYQGEDHIGETLRRETPGTPITIGGRADDEMMQTIHLEPEPEPEPVLQIGRYTYVRSDADEFCMSLIREDGTRRYMTKPVSRMGSHSFRKSQPKPKPKSMGPHGFSLTHEALFVLIICLSQVLMLSGIAQALVPAKIMGQSFPDTQPGDLAWYTAAYGLTSGTFVLPAGRLGDIFGHKRVFIIGFVWFSAWSLLAGFSPMVQRTGANGTIFFIVSRALQGVGPAILVPNGQAMLGRAYSPGLRKNMVMCLFGAAAPLGFVVGAAMSALFAVRASWSWAFWTMAAVCIALAAISVPVLPSDRPGKGQVVLEDQDQDNLVTSKTKKESLWIRMDVAGMVLGVGGLILVNFAFNQAPIVGWATPYTYFLLVIGLLFLGAFAYVENAAATTHPLVPFSSMSAMTNFVLGCTATGWGCFSVWVYYAVSTFENLRGWSPLLTSAAFAPAPLSGLAASLLTGFLFSRAVKPHWVMLISMCAFFIGSLLFATGPPEQLYWYNSFFAILVMPFGMDMSNPAAIILLSNSVGKEHQGIAASLVVTFVNYAISLALGIAGSVEAGVYDADDLLRGYRAAQYFGLGLGGLGILLATAFLCQHYLRKPEPVVSQPHPPPAEKSGK